MSKILTKTVKKTTVLSILVAMILAAAIAVGIICGVKGYGVFNKSAMLSDSKTVTISLNQHAYLTKLEDVEKECETAFASLDIEYEMKGEMSGDESEIVYVFDAKTSDADLAAAKKAVDAKFDALTDGEWKGNFIQVSSASEKVVKVLVKNYVLRGVIAGAVMAVLIFAYVAIRYRLSMGVVAAVSTLLGGALTAAIVILARIPVAASVSYVFAVSALVSAVMTLLTFNKVRANANKEGMPADEMVASSIATKEIVTFAVVAGVALVVVGACATAGVRWFAILSLIGLVAATFIGWVYAPSLYIPFKKAEDSKPAKDAYVGAKKSSTKAKKENVAVAPVENAVKTAPVAEPVEEAVEEAPAEDPVEEAVEEAPAEEPVEETVEEVPAEEPVEETVEEVPVEEPAAEEENA